MLVAPAGDTNGTDVARSRRGGHARRHPRSRSPGRRRRHQLAGRPGRSPRRRDGGDPLSGRTGPPAHRAADGRCAHAAQPRAHRGLPRGVRRGRDRSRPAPSSASRHRRWISRRATRSPCCAAPSGRRRSLRSERASWRACCARRATSACRCPRDLSVLSVGDTDLAAVHTPAITALRWSLEDVGRAAAELLLQRLRGDARPGAVPRPAAGRPRAARVLRPARDLRSAPLPRHPEFRACKEIISSKSDHWHITPAT